MAAFADSSWFVRLPFDDQVQTSPGSIEMWFTFPSGNTADRELFDEKKRLERGVGRHTGYIYVGVGMSGGYWPQHPPNTAHHLPIGDRGVAMSRRAGREVGARPPGRAV
ncbi:hypothetical protein ABZ914_04680 [Spirillospora sp. NPDC046719]